MLRGAFSTAPGGRVKPRTARGARYTAAENLS